MVRLPMQAAPTRAAGEATTVEPGTPGLSLMIQEAQPPTPASVGSISGRR
jgi:hypothetical protein